MRKTVLCQSPHVRVSLSALLAFVLIVAVAGCGGGGGGGTTNGGTTNGGTTNGGTNGGNNPSGTFLTGRVVDTTTPAQGVVGAVITLSGPGVASRSITVTSPDGTFTISNVDPKYTSFKVASPDPTKWYNFALYNAKQYDTINCSIPLPTLVAGSNSLVGNVVLVSASNNPPPPPPVNGCP